jgi:hypothetical protein
MAAYEITHDITIKDIKLTKIISVNIVKNVNNYTNTCTIKLPKKVRKENERIFTTIDSFLFKPKDVGTVQLGYRLGTDVLNDENQFEGFVSIIDLNDEKTATIILEDYMYWLKKTKFNFSSKSITLADLGAKIITEVNNIIPDGIDKIEQSTTTIDLDIKNFKAENATGVDILRQMEKYTLKSYFIKNVLHIGINYDSDTINKEVGSIRETHTFSEYPRELVATVTDKRPLFIIDKKGLKFQREEEVIFNITAKIFQTDNTVITKTFGDPDGETREFVFYGDYSDKEVEKLVENQVARLKYTGFKNGSTFSSFGAPYIEVLDICSFDGIGDVTLFDKSIPEEADAKIYEKSSYLIEGVTTTMDQNGFRQILMISNRVKIDSDSDSIVNLLETKLIDIETDK